MDIENQIKYWIDSSQDDIISAESIFNNKNYSWALFIAHLALEKALKAFFVFNKKQIPPKSHKLDYLAEAGALEITDEEISFLKLVNEFNLEARYPDAKRKFKELCTESFTKEYLNKIKQMQKWIIGLIKN